MAARLPLWRVHSSFGFLCGCWSCTAAPNCARARVLEKEGLLDYFIRAQGLGPLRKLPLGLPHNAWNGTFAWLAPSPALGLGFYGFRILWVWDFTGGCCGFRV